MLRAACVSLLFVFSTFALCQNSDRQSPLAPQSSSAVQVVYVVDGSTLTTYNIDPQTLYPTQVGTLTMPESTYPNIDASANGRFLYYSAYNDPSESTHVLLVYATDGTGAPQNPPVQQVNANGLYGGIAIDPKANFLYAVYAAPGAPYYTTYTIRRFVLDPNTGRISQSQAEATYSLPNGAEGTEYCGLSILGFNPAGTRLYDEVFCGYHGGSSATYNERGVNLQTGALGRDAQVYSWNNSYGGGEYVQFVNGLLFDFVNPNSYQQGANSVNIYPVKPNTSTPIVQCTASMLQACGYAGGVAHPSGKYVFMGITQDSTQIDRVELGAHKIVDTTNYIPYRFGQFSPDGTLVYGVYDPYPAYNIEIYGFNVATGAVRTNGGVIALPSDLDSWFTAQRY
jgi:hypothetical protein